MKASALRLCAVACGLWLLCVPTPGGAGTQVDASTSAVAVPTKRAPASLEELMARFARSRGVRSKFKETRYLSILMAPIESEGMLYFERPDSLARHTVRPGNASVVVRGDEVVIRDETGEQRLDLSVSEIARELVGNLVVVLQGDLVALGERYEAGFHERGDGWSLELEPRSRAMRRIVESIRFEGRGDVMLSMETRETNGDRTVVTFEDVETDVVFTPSERERIFGLESSSATR